MAPERFVFPRSSRIVKRAELQAVLRNGKRVRSRLLELRGLASHSHLARVGLIIPKHGRSAVQRNRLKRQLREIIRIEFLPQLGGSEVVLRTLPSAYAASAIELRRDLDQLWPRLQEKLC